MKLLLDQNISYRLVKKLDPQFPETQHVKRLGLGNKPDRIIWEHAKKEGYVLVTFDSDFYDFSLTLGHPPKLILIKSRNLTTSNLERLFFTKREQIEAFYTDDELSCIELFE